VKGRFGESHLDLIGDDRLELISRHQGVESRAVISDKVCARAFDE
jgi:hypothetical protein